MIENNGRLKDKILLTLDNNPIHGYGLLKLLEKDGQTIMITTLYRWLHKMESEGLVESETHPSPHGPPRRVYRLGEEGCSRLRDIVRNAIQVVTHTYEQYNYFRIGQKSKLLPKNLDVFNGPVLFSASHKSSEFDSEVLAALARRCNRSQLYILGTRVPVPSQKSGYKRVKGDITDIRSRKRRYSIVWLNGVPENAILPLAIAEVHRVLKEGGNLFMISPFTLFERPRNPSLGTYLSCISADLSPDCGARDGNFISRILNDFFPITHVREVFPEFVVFQSTKKGEL
ncbi:MAG: helix-turn-helix transcriptional regulator [Promethearchaeota archaeon]